MAESDEEFVERMRYIEHAHEPLKEADRDRLLSLADRGAAVRWRKIEEAPRDGTSLLGVTPYDFDARIFAWGKTSHLPLYGWVYIDQGVEDREPCFPTHFIPLTALGEPDDRT